MLFKSTACRPLTCGLGLPHMPPLHNARPPPPCPAHLRPADRVHVGGHPRLRGAATGGHRLQHDAALQLWAGGSGHRPALPHQTHQQASSRAKILVPSDGHANCGVLGAASIGASTRPASPCLAVCCPALACIATGRSLAPASPDARPHLRTHLRVTFPQCRPWPAPTPAPPSSPPLWGASWTGTRRRRAATLRQRRWAPGSTAACPRVHEETPLGPFFGLVFAGSLPLPT